MASLDDTHELMDLTLPATHNSAAYESRTFLWRVKDYMLCQSHEVYDQLNMGIRLLDLRLCRLSHQSGLSDEIYCSHTFLSVPLIKVAHDVWRFLSE